MYIIGGTASKRVAAELSKLLTIPNARILSKRFPDNELYIRILDDIRGEDVMIVQTTYPDASIIELFLLQNAVTEADANTITVVIPYFGYSRQDKKFKVGEPISAQALARLISLNANEVITIDPHKEHILDFFSISAYSCSAIQVLANHLKNKDIDLVLAPDKGALDRAKQTSKILNCEYDFMEKTRINSSTVEIKPKSLDAENKNIVIIDDIISTGGTMAKSIEKLKQDGARKILAVCTHGLFSNDAAQKLVSAGCDDIIATDTIWNEFSKVQVAPCIADAVATH